MALTTAQKALVETLDAQVKDLKQTVMASPHCTMGGMGNYLFDAFKKLEAQVDAVKKS